VFTITVNAPVSGMFFYQLLRLNSSTLIFRNNYPADVPDWFNPEYYCPQNIYVSLNEPGIE
jgi:hypothetical protein